MSYFFLFVAAFLGAIAGTMLVDLAFKVIEHRRLAKRFKGFQARLNAELAKTGRYDCFECASLPCDCDE